MTPIHDVESPRPTHLRVALVGGGKMAGHHARAIMRSQQPVRLVAVADPDPAVRGELVRTLGNVSQYDSPEALLAADKPDVVHVCTPPPTHAKLGLLALRAGCHVYIEKPFVETAEDCEQLLAVAEERGLAVCAGYQLLFEPPSVKARELLPSLGSVVHIESYFSFRPVRHRNDGRTPLRSDHQLLDILPHPVYMLLDFLERATLGGNTELKGLSIGPGGTAQALVRRGDVTGTLIVTLEGRPVESYLRIVGTNGSIHADYVRSTLQRAIGPGSSGIDKLLDPYRKARQLVTGTTRSLASRLLNRQKSYPGLTEIFDAFYGSILAGKPSPVSTASIRGTVDLCGQVAAAIEANREADRQVAEETTGTGTTSALPGDASPLVAVTGGTGWLGNAVVSALQAQGARVRVVSRRLPAPWERREGVDYATANLAESPPVDAFSGVEAVIHCAAATAGGFEEHQKNSVDATEHVLEAARAADVKRVVHVSSMSVLANSPSGEPVNEQSPLVSDRSSGPYAWGKAQSERLAVERAAELGLEVYVVRPGAIVDYESFDPPGKLGKRIGNLFVAVGSARDRLGVVELGFAAAAIAWIALRPHEAPGVVNLLSPELPAKRELLKALRRDNPDLRVVWLPRFALVPLSWVAVGLQKALRPGKPALNPARVFAGRALETARARSLADQLGYLAPAATGSQESPALSSAAKREPTNSRAEAR